MRVGILLVVAVVSQLLAASSPQAEPSAPAARNDMTRARFWKVVGEARAGTRDDEVFIRRLTASLGRASAKEVAAFRQHFDELHGESYSWALWGACYLARGGCSDDSFEYFRAWLISQGRPVFERAIRNPDGLAALPRLGELEAFLYVAAEVYQQKTGKQLPYAPRHPSRPLGTDWDFEDRAEMKKRYPRLFAKFDSRPSR